MMLLLGSPQARRQPHHAYFVKVYLRSLLAIPSVFARLTTSGKTPSFVPWHVEGIPNAAKDPESFEPPSGPDMIPAVPRTLKIKKADIMEHGPTEGCPGCRAAIADAAAKNHSDSCRQRIEELAQNDS